MFELEDMEGIKDTPSLNSQNLELSDIHREYLAELIPEEPVWQDMAETEKNEIQELLESRMDEIRDLAGNKNIDFSCIIPEYMLKEMEYPFRDMNEFEEVSKDAVKWFFESNLFNLIPYAEASIELRQSYIEGFYAKFSEQTGYNPKLCFEEMPPYRMGSYNPQTNTITLNTRMLRDEAVPFKLMDTILHESRHAFQQYAVDHPESVSVPPETIAIWEHNMRNYIKSEWDYEAYIKQPIEEDARKFAENAMTRGLTFTA